MWGEVPHDHLVLSYHSFQYLLVPSCANTIRAAGGLDGTPRIALGPSALTNATKFLLASFFHVWTHSMWPGIANYVRIEDYVQEFWGHLQSSIFDPTVHLSLPNSVRSKIMSKSLGASSIFNLRSNRTGPFEASILQITLKYFVVDDVVGPSWGASQLA